MDPIAAWTALLRPERELHAGVRRVAGRCDAERKLTFGDRVHCPVLRPFFLTAADEARIRRAAETLAGSASAWWRRRWTTRGCSRRSA